jgi:protein-L-isoaspartate(D-aspartate) O-methyltransferase
MRRRLVVQLRRSGYLHDARVAGAFLDVPREEFLREELVELGLAGVYRDEAIVTRRDPQTNLPTSSSSQPAIMALMLEMLDVQPGDRIVEIGAGTGYNAAILDRLTGPDGRVVTVDVDPDVARRAATALRGVGSPAQVVVADGTQPLPLVTTVDRIEVTASSTALPRPWYDQLRTGGRLVVPLRFSDEPDRAHAVTAFAKVPGGFDSVALTPGGFMPLRHTNGTVFCDLSGVTSSPSERRPPPTTGSAADTGSAPERASGLPPLTRGPVPGVSREDIGRLHITVRYDAPRPSTRWTFKRDDHWIGVDLD